LRPLNDAARRRMFAWSAVFCAVPLCLAPLAGRSSFELASERAAFDTRFNAPTLDAAWNGRPVDVARDPFMPEVHTPRTLQADSSIVGMRVTQGEPTGWVLPANRGAAGAPLIDAAVGAVNVTAVVTGSSPRALVDDGTHVRVVSIGDALAGSRIAAIDGNGVHLQNGTVLALAQESP
jgi:hypothetical protein